MEKEEAVVTSRCRSRGSSLGTNKWFSGLVCGSEGGSSPRSLTTVMSRQTGAPLMLVVGVGVWEGEGVLGLVRLVWPGLACLSCRASLPPSLPPLLSTLTAARRAGRGRGCP